MVLQWVDGGRLQEKVVVAHKKVDALPRAKLVRTSFGREAAALTRDARKRRADEGWNRAPAVLQVQSRGLQAKRAWAGGCERSGGAEN